MVGMRNFQDTFEIIYQRFFNLHDYTFKVAATGIWKLIASDKSNLLRKFDFLLKSGFQVIAFYVSLEVGYLAVIVLNFVYKWARQLFSGHHKIMPNWFIFSEYFSDWWFNFIMFTWLYFFSKYDTKMIAIKF